MIYLDSSVALAHRLAEDRFPPDALWDQQLVSAGFSNAGFAIGSTRTNCKIRVARRFLAARHALEAAGVEFIDENGGGAGVRLRKPGKEKPRK